MCKVQRKTLFFFYFRAKVSWLILPSLFHITSLNLWCTGHLTDVRDEQCPSHYPHSLGHIHSLRKMAWGLEAKKVRETWGRTVYPHVSLAHCTSALEPRHVKKWGTFWCINLFQALAGKIRIGHAPSVTKAHVQSEAFGLRVRRLRTLSPSARTKESNI